jgi:hypothetical protein
MHLDLATNVAVKVFDEAFFNVMFLLHRTTVCKVETTSCRLVKLICEVWALNRWQQCCDSLAAMFA